MYLGKTLLALSVTAALTACGGGGGGTATPAPSVINLTPLVGTDTSVTGSFKNSCTGTGIDIATWQATAAGDVLVFVVSDKYSVKQLEFTLKYVSGDNIVGYNFNGSVKNLLTNQVASVESTLLKNTSASGSLNMTGTINATDRGCSVTIQLT